jgi:hypothetical protein
MASMVDSKQKELNSADIIRVALENTKSEYPPNVAMPAIVMEMKQPNTDVKQIGNTLFIMHMGKGGQSFFKALNADTAKNFVDSSKQYIVYAKNDLGQKLLVTEFKEPAISTLFKMISKNPPLPGMGYKEYKTTDGGRRIVLNLGA